jgi:hypothetical protein
MSEEKICPFMSGIGTRSANNVFERMLCELVEVPCLKERCAAWGIARQVFGSPNRVDYGCRLIP